MFAGAPTKSMIPRRVAATLFSVCGGLDIPMPVGCTCLNTVPHALILRLKTLCASERKLTGNCYQRDEGDEGIPKQNEVGGYAEHCLLDTSLPIFILTMAQHESLATPAFFLRRKEHFGHFSCAIHLHDFGNHL